MIRHRFTGARPGSSAPRPRRTKNSPTAFPPQVERLPRAAPHTLHPQPAPARDGPLAHGSALFGFIEVPGNDPTLYVAERVCELVLWHKISQDSPSERGCLFAQRPTTVLPALRPPRWSVFALLPRRGRSRGSAPCAFADPVNGYGSGSGDTRAPVLRRAPSGATHPATAVDHTLPPGPSSPSRRTSTLRKSRSLRSSDQV